MAKLVCTSHLSDVGPTAARTYPGSTVKAVLQNAQAEYPRLGNYVLDDQERLRKHVAVFVNGDMLPRATALTHPVADSDEVFLMQALSGG